MENESLVHLHPGTCWGDAESQQTWRSAHPHSPSSTVSHSGYFATENQDKNNRQHRISAIHRRRDEGIHTYEAISQRNDTKRLNALNTFILIAKFSEQLGRSLRTKRTLLHEWIKTKTACITTELQNALMLLKRRFTLVYFR